MLYALTQNFYRMDEGQFHLAIKFLNRLGYQIVPRMNNYCSEDEIPEQLQEIIRKCFVRKRESTRRIMIDGEWKQPYELTEDEIFGIAGIVLWNLHQRNGNKRCLLLLPEWRELPVLTALFFILREVSEDKAYRMYRQYTQYNPEKKEIVIKWNDAKNKIYYDCDLEKHLTLHGNAPDYLYRQIIGNGNVTSEMLADGIRYWDENKQYAGCYYGGKFSTEFNPSEDFEMEDAMRRIYDLSMMRNGPTEWLKTRNSLMRKVQENEEQDRQYREELAKRRHPDDFWFPFIMWFVLPMAVILPIALFLWMVYYFVI